MIFLIGSGKHSGVVESSLKKLKIKFINISKKSGIKNDKIIEKKFLKGKKNSYLHIAIGDNKTREKVYFFYKKKNYKFKSIFDTTAIISKKVSIGEGVYIGPGVIINNNSKIKDNCIINSGCIVEHDTKIGSHVHMAPGSKIMGSTTIGKRNFIGAGAIINNNLKIVDNCTIGSGTVVIRNLNIKGLYAGIPAKKKK